MKKPVKIRVKNTPPDKSKEFLANWYQKRSIPDSYIQEAFNLDKPAYLQNIKQFPEYKEVKRIDNNVTGRYEPLSNTVLVKQGAPSHVKTHELSHFINTKDNAGGYMRTIHKDIVKNELMPKEQVKGVYKNRYDYFSDPDEVHARIMVLREKAGIKPDEVVSPERLRSFLDTYKGDVDNINDLLNISKGEQGLLNMLNFMAKNKVKKSNLA